MYYKQTQYYVENRHRTCQSVVRGVPCTALTEQESTLCNFGSVDPCMQGRITRFRDLDERWKSASTGRRNRLPHLLPQTIDPARWGRRFRLPFPWPQSMVAI